MAVKTTGLYANHMHFAPVWVSQHHPIAQFLTRVSVVYAIVICLAVCVSVRHTTISKPDK